MAPLFETPARPGWRRCTGHLPWGARHTLLLLAVLALAAANAWQALRVSEAAADTPPTPAATTVPIANPGAHSRVADPAAAQMDALLHTPWAQWLSAFEAHLPADAALLTLEPDARSRRVDVEAQAPTLSELLAFGQALERAPLVAAVEPLAHLPAEDNGAAAHLRMRWRLLLHPAPGSAP